MPSHASPSKTTSISISSPLTWYVNTVLSFNRRLPDPVGLTVGENVGMEVSSVGWLGLGFDPGGGVGETVGEKVGISVSLSGVVVGSLVGSLVGSRAVKMVDQ